MAVQSQGAVWHLSTGESRNVQRQGWEGVAGPDADLDTGKSCWEREHNPFVITRTL